jgi:radical SAM-linked protein
MNSQNITKSNPAIFRFKFLKKAEYKYLSHLDIINIMIRAVARSGIKIKYDQGFNPKPKISFSNPTPLGVESLAEYCDITIIGEINENDFLNPVNAQLPEQLKIVDLKKVSEKIPSLMSDISVVLYSFKLKSVSNKPGREADVFDNEAENLKGGRLKLKDAVEKGYANFRSIYKLEFESYTDNNIDTNTSDDTGIIKGISDSADTPGNIIFLKIFGYAKILKDVNNFIFKFNNFISFFSEILKESDFILDSVIKQEMYILQNGFLKNPLEVV